jgi:PAS domain S-box-containing protein
VRPGRKKAENSLTGAGESHGDTAARDAGRSSARKLRLFTKLTQIEIGGIFPVYSVTCTSEASGGRLFLTKQTEDATVLDGRSVHAEDAFQRLLLQFSAVAAQGSAPAALIHVFCRATREFFQVDGVYLWEFTSDEELVGAEADGYMADRFRGTRIKTSDSAIAVEAVHERKTVYVNRLDPAHSAAEFRARSMMAAPLVVSKVVIGAAVFLHQSDPDFFNDDLAAKATILAGQLGSLLEASRLTQKTHEEHRRAEILAEVAQALHSVPDGSSVVEAVADRLRILLRTPLVCVLLRKGGNFELTGVAAESPEVELSVRARHDRKGLHFAADLAARALAAGEAITVAMDPATHTLSGLVPSGVLMAAPFRTSETEGAVLVYPRREGGFTTEEKSLVSAIVSFGAVAMANAELYETARAQAHELHQILSISSELGSSGQLDHFMQQFVLRGSDFLGFSRAFLALRENGVLHIRWKYSQGESSREDSIFPDGVASRTLLNKEVFWSDHPAEVPGANAELVAKHNVKQMLAVPLLGTDGEVLGIFGVLDRLDQAPISPEDIRRAQALATQVAIALEVTRNLEISERHRRRAESLMGLALELNALLRLPEFAKSFVARAVDMMGASAAALTVRRESVLETVVLQGVSDGDGLDSSVSRDFERAVNQALTQHDGAIVSSTAVELFGQELAQKLGWADCTFARLLGASGELVGVLCLANRGKLLTAEDRQLLQAIAGHASVALENAHFFARMEQANRHWTEIFDAITDFIVAHDESGNVLRVNRSLAEFIGVQPNELIGLNMSTLLAMGSQATLGPCPFCRSAGEGTDEFVHPGLERTFWVSTSRVHSASSEVLQTIHVLKDITDRREAERRYRELFDNVQEGLFFSTPDGRFIEVNDALVRMLGYHSREELLQVDVRRQLYSSAERTEEIAAEIEKHGALKNHEEALRRKDGSIVHVLINAFAVRDAQGRIMQYRGLMLDISGLKSYQNELQRERDFSGKILNNTQSLILVVDTAGLVSYANRRWYDMGYEQKQILGRPLEELVAPARREVLGEAFAAILAGNQVDNLELQVLRADKRMGHFSVNLSPMRDEPGNVTSIVVVMSDVTEAATLQAKLMHTERMAAVGQLVSGVAHEVNNPLTAILGFADLLMENPEIPESARKDLRVILQEAQRTKQIVQNLLSFARQMPPQRKPVQINTILRRTLELRAYDFHSRGVEISEHLAQELPYVVGDSHQLQQVFLNIVNNAYDAVREAGRPGRIDITTSKQGGFVEVSFRDNGHGVTSPDRIFDPFFTTKEVGKGTGLGLSICYGIVHEHGGEIYCHNNEGAEGATFVVRFPASPELVSVGTAAGAQP